MLTLNATNCSSYYVYIGEKRDELLIKQKSKPVIWGNCVMFSLTLGSGSNLMDWNINFSDLSCLCIYNLGISQNSRSHITSMCVLIFWMPHNKIHLIWYQEPTFHKHIYYIAVTEDKKHKSMVFANLQHARNKMLLTMILKYPLWIHRGVLWLTNNSTCWIHVCFVDV